jgi:hypothetical protein
MVAYSTVQFVCFVSLLVFVHADSFGEMCRGLILQGGGSKGAY